MTDDGAAVPLQPDDVGATPDLVGVAAAVPDKLLPDTFVECIVYLSSTASFGQIKVIKPAYQVLVGQDTR